MYIIFSFWLYRCGVWTSRWNTPASVDLPLLALLLSEPNAYEKYYAMAVARKYFLVEVFAPYPSVYLPFLSVSSRRKAAAIK